MELQLSNEGSEMSMDQTVGSIVERLVADTASEREKAVRLHNYVRDNIKFGFTKYFDAVSPDYILACGIGHCNQKSALMVALFRTAGLESHQHFIAMRKDILKGSVPGHQYWIIPAEVSHSYVEVKVEGAWSEIDSHIVDTPLLKGAQSRLTQENQKFGYGTFLGATNQWDGQGRAFSQYHSDLLVEDHGRVENLEAYFRSKKYRARILGLSFNTLFPLMGRFGAPAVNSQFEKVRKRLCT
jgi:transglutaminase-like putative cysteine protease